MTHPLVAERLTLELSLLVLTTQVYADRGSNPDLPHARRTLYLYAIVVVLTIELIAQHVVNIRTSKFNIDYNSAFY